MKQFGRATIVIVGGGFSGTVAAINLARNTDGPLRICLINNGFPLGRGIAYSTQRSEHLLNVVARNMSALADQPNHFVQWLTTRSEYANLPEPELRETFVPRKIYGDYIHGLLHYYMHHGHRSREVEINCIAGETVDITTHGCGAVVFVAPNERIEADRVLLATGNAPPMNIPAASAHFQHSHYVDNPWTDFRHLLTDRHQSVVLFGTGLTMIDVFLLLSTLDWRVPIIAVSRNGLLPLSHFRGIEYPDFPPADVESLGLNALTELIQAHCVKLRGRGANPAIVVDKLRVHTQRIWQHFSLEEKQEFFQRYRAQWNITRHRIAPQIHEQVTKALETGALRIEKGSIQSLSRAGNLLRVALQNSIGEERNLDAALVVNCTGPQEKFSAIPSQLYQNLLNRGLISLDELDMGIRATSDFAVLDAHNQHSEYLYAIGPMLKGTLWETTAVPELRGQALRVAQTLLDTLGIGELQRDAWHSTVEPPLLEYCI